MTRELKPCGTLAAARRHKRHKEAVCEPCRAAEAAYNKDYWKTYRRPRRFGTSKAAA